MKKYYQATSQQTIFDVALQHYGDVSGIGLLLEDNPTLVDAQGNLDLSIPLLIREKVTLDAFVSDQYSGAYDNYVPSTDGMSEGTDFVLIDENSDFITDDNGETPVSNFN